MILSILSLFYASALLLFLCARRNQKLIVDQYKKANVKRFRRASTKNRSPYGGSEGAEKAKRIPSGDIDVGDAAGKNKNASKKDKAKMQNKNEHNSCSKTNLRMSKTLTPPTSPKKHGRKRNKHKKNKKHRKSGDDRSTKETDRDDSASQPKPLGGYPLTTTTTSFERDSSQSGQKKCVHWIHRTYALSVPMPKNAKFDEL